MRTIGIISSIPGIIAADPCSRLCQFDGSQICTGGSWTKDGSGGSKVCHSYHHMVPNGHCYHTSMTRATCPSTSPPIKPSEVDAIIARLSEERAHGAGTTDSPTTTTFHIYTPSIEESGNTVRIAKDPCDATAEMTPLPLQAIANSNESVLVPEANFDLRERDKMETAFRDLEDTINNLNAGYLETDISFGEKVFEVIYAARNFFRYSRFADPVYNFVRFKGHLLFDYAVKNSIRDYEFIRSALLLPMLLPVEPHDFERFRMESGLAAFCSDHSDYIRNAFLYLHHEGMRALFPDTVDMFRFAFVGANLPKYCPELLDKFPELVPVVIEQRLYMSVVDADGVLASEQSLQHSQIVSRAHAFTQSIDEIMSRHPKSLRCITVSKRFEGQIDIGNRVGREFISLAAEEIFNISKSIYFTGSDAGVIQIKPTGPLDHFEAIGRFMGHSLAHDVSLGVSFPDFYVALLLGKITEVEVEPVIKARLDLMVEGFQAVVPPDMMEDFLTVERLAQTFLGASRINVAEMIVRLDFLMKSSIDDQGYPVQISWLIRYLESLDQDNLKKFSRLICGRSVAPIGGFSSIRPRIGVLFGDTPDGLPRAQAHASKIVVPLYKNEAELIQSFNRLLSSM